MNIYVYIYEHIQIYEHMFRPIHYFEYITIAECRQGGPGTGDLPIISKDSDSIQYQVHQNSANGIFNQHLVIIGNSNKSSENFDTPAK